MGSLPLQRCDSTLAAQSVADSTGSPEWLMKMAGVLVVFVRLAAETKLCLTRLWVKLMARRLYERSPADVAADPNDRLKLVTVQGEWEGELEVGGVSTVRLRWRYVCVCVYRRILLLPGH